MKDFLITISALVGRRVKVVLENPNQEGLSYGLTAMLEDVDLAAEKVKLEGHDLISARDIYRVTIINPGFSKRADR